MKIKLTLILILMTGLNAIQAQPNQKSKGSENTNSLYIDVHYLEPGKVKYEDVAEAHMKDLKTQDKYGVKFIKYWVDEKNGMVYCLSSSPDSNTIKNAHAEAHGLVPGKVYMVKAGEETPGVKPENLYLDIHHLGEGKVTAADVSEAHKKDLAMEGKHDVSFINYWVDEQAGVVFCLSQAESADDVVKTHTEAHGLVPATIVPVKEGK